MYFGPKAPAGKETNWVPTDANGKFEVLFRLYGPEKPFFDKAWVLPDIEKAPIRGPNHESEASNRGVNCFL